jgi:hypothetical protein
MSVTARGKRWEILHSLWIGWTFTLGFFNWVAFFYISYRAKQKKWLLWGLFYAIPFVLAMGFGIGSGGQGVNIGWLSDLTYFLTIVLGLMSILHAFKIRKEYLIRLESVQNQARTNESLLRERVATQYQTNDQGAPPASNREIPKVPNLPRPTLEEPYTPSDQPPEASPSQEPVPPLVAVDDLSNQTVPEHLGPTSIPTNYPLPLAYSYRLADAEFETFRVLKELYRNAEGLTAFLASLALVLATIEEDKGHLYRSMQQLLGTKANPSSFAETMSWLIDRRNDLHHGDLPVGPRAELLIQEVRSRFEHCVSESAALWQHPLRLVLDYDAVRNKDYVVATCLDFSGDHPVGRKVQERYQGIPKKQDLYILQDGKQWISLYPFISVHYCPHCNARETYFVDAWQGTGEEANLRSFERSHEEVSEEIGQELTLRLER